MPAIVVMILLAVNFPVYVLIGRLIFGSVDEFGEAFGYLLQSEFWTWAKGEGPQYEWAQLRFSVFFGVSGLILFGEYKLVMFVIEKMTAT
jgi:hypothetical protein